VLLFITGVPVNMIQTTNTLMLHIDKEFLEGNSLFLENLKCLMEKYVIWIRNLKIKIKN